MPARPLSAGCPLNPRPGIIRSTALAPTAGPVTGGLGVKVVDIRVEGVYQRRPIEERDQVLLDHRVLRYGVSRWSVEEPVGRELLHRSVRRLIPPTPKSPDACSPQATSSPARTRTG